MSDPDKSKVSKPLSVMELSGDTYAIGQTDTGDVFLMINDNEPFYMSQLEAKMLSLALLHAIQESTE